MVKIPIELIKLFSILYISFPLIPFYSGWLKPHFGIPLLIILFFGFYKYFKNLDFSIILSINKFTFFSILFIVFIWVSFSGSGGMGYQFYDHVKNNTLAVELSDRKWPISYDVNGETLYLSHYLGFYIVSPFILGLIGYKYVQLGVFIYTLIGILLGTFWILLIAKKVKVSSLLIFIVFGGGAAISILLKQKELFFNEIVNLIKNHSYVFWLNCWEIIPLNYLSKTDLLYWTPQHFIPTLLGMGILLYDGLIKEDMKYTPFFLSLILFWSPMILVGIFPFFLFFLYKSKFKNVFNSVNLIIALLLFLINASYILAIDSQSLIKGFIFVSPEINHFSYLKQIGAFLYFLVFEVFIWVIPIWFILKKSMPKDEKHLFILTSLLLILIPLYRFGLWNDWCGRISTPALTVITIFAIKAFHESKKLKKMLISSIIVIGSLSFIIDFTGSLYFSNFRIKFSPPEKTAVGTLPEICVSYPIEQFVATKNTFFFTYLAKD